MTESQQEKYFLVIMLIMIININMKVMCMKWSLALPMMQQDLGKHWGRIRLEPQDKRPGSVFPAWCAVLMTHAARYHVRKGYFKNREFEMMKSLIVAVITVAFSLAGTAYAAHPLITDDTATQGKGKSQFEFIGEYRHDRDDSITTNSLVVPTIPVLSYGITDSADLVLGFSYQHIETKQDGITTSERGISDASIQLKWRFYEKDGLSFAMKPGVTLPTGDENKGLGNGKVSYNMFFITTKEIAPWAFHFNAGYIRNEYKLQADEDASIKDIWHVSLASQVEVTKDLKAVANIGMERNPDKTSNTSPAFILCGIICSITGNVDIDLGVKGGLNKPETDITYLAGITWRL
jgi:hypothetical protein